MKYLLHIATFLLALLFVRAKGCKLVCYYDISSASVVGPSRFTGQDMELALHLCTHIVYSYVTLTPSKNSVTVLSPEREEELEKMEVFKAKHPNVKFLLSLGGENNWKTTKGFLDFLETDHFQKKQFIKSLMKTVIQYKFDGLSLDLPLPRVKPITSGNSYRKMWDNFVNFFKRNSERDNKASLHRDMLTTFIQQLSAYLKDWQGLLTLNVLPNVDSGKYYDSTEIIKYLDFVVLSAFDFYTPENSPKEADLMSPTKPDGLSGQRLPLTNVKSFYKSWHSQSVPRYKIVIGIAAYGRAWKMTKNSNADGVPPVENTNGPAAAGPYTQKPGFLSWLEICEKLAHDPKLTRVTDERGKAGAYAYRPASSNGNHGIWISYEDPITAGVKAVYVRNHNLGGVALFDLSLDDLHGDCSGEKFPILRSIKFKLTRFKS